MERIKEHLEQAIELRVDQIRKEIEDESRQPDRAQMKGYTERMERVLAMLPESERGWLDDQLMHYMIVPEKERISYYKAGLADALKLLQHL